MMFWPGAEVTDDLFLGGKLRIFQPAKGFRAGTDSVLLAAFSCVHPGWKVMDVGCGAGTAGLCLAVRVPGIQVTGVEIDPFYARLSRINAQRNGIRSWITIETDIGQPSAPLRRMNFDAVMSNPPYFAVDSGSLSQNRARDRARREKECTLEVWIDFCLKRLRSQGLLTIVYHVSRIDRLLAVLSKRIGRIHILPLAAHPESSASRVIISGIKDSRAPLTLLPPLVAHESSGVLSPQVQALLQGKKDYFPCDLKN